MRVHTMSWKDMPHSSRVEFLAQERATSLERVLGTGCLQCARALPRQLCPDLWTHIAGILLQRIFEFIRGVTSRGG